MPNATIDELPIGVAVDANDPDAWAAAIRTALARDGNDREAVAIAARAEVERHYRWPRVIDETLAIYGEVDCFNNA
jgi:glycosyltransferase involved in cell wall biosynthesis